MITYTPEQADTLDWLVENDGIMLVQAGAGCGKSFMARQYVNELKPKSGIYTAFNKAIVEEGVNRFAGTPIECKTFHALAYRYVKPDLPIENFTYKSITERLTYTEKRRIIDSLDEFFVSASTCMDEYFEAKFEGHPRAKFMADIATKYVQGMADGDVNPTFNFMLKCLHLMLIEKTVVIELDIIILDEINDVTAVFLEIFRLIDAPKKVGLGETNQAIYQFLNLVDGFEVLKNEATTMHFTQSYRCSIDIAKRIERTMKREMHEDFKFVGTDKPVTNGLTLFCTLTNAMIVDGIYQRLEQGKGFKLLRKPADIFAAPLAVLSASQGKKPYQKQYEYLMDLFEEYKDQSEHKSYYKFLSAELDDTEINNAVRLLMKLASSGVNLYSLFKEAKEAPVDDTYVISTVFTAKGLEFQTVYIADDLNSNFTSACDGELDEEKILTAKRCYYVACSRSGTTLRNSVI
jgi:superfamily I DNA/RNA helicase